MKLKKIFWVLVIAVIFLRGGHSGFAVQPAAPVNDFCLVTSGEKLDGKTFADYQGKTYGFCCKSCAKKFKKNPGKYIARFAASKECALGVCTDKKESV